jgi:hypothetical protein
MANTPIGSLTATWNNGGTTYHAIKMNVTNSASAAGSRLLTLQIGGTDKAYIDKNGALYLSGEITLAANDAGALGASGTAFSDLFLASGGVLNWNAGDVTVTHSANLLAFAGATSGYTFDNKLVVGHTANLSIGGNADNLEVLGTDAATGAMAIGVFSATSTTQGRLDFYKSANAAIGSATAVVSGERLGILQWWGAQQTGTFSNQNRAATMRVEVDGTVTDGAGADMPGRFVFATTADGSGTPTDRLILDSAGVLKPNANDGVALGTTALSFSDLFLASGAVVGWNNGDVTLTHSANQLTFAGAATGYSFDAPILLASGVALNWNAGDVTITHSANLLAFGGASSGYTFDAVIKPSANDGAALGVSGTAWSDAFFATGAVIDFAAGDVTVTHSANLLAFGGASSGYSFDAAVKPSANDAAALGVSGTAWADAFFASGAVLNFNAGNYTVTHSAGLLTTNGALTIVGAHKQSADDGGALGASGTGWSDLFLASGGVINWNAGDVTLTHSAGALTLAGAFTTSLTITSNLGFASSVTSNTTYVMGSYRNLSNGAAAQLQFNFGNDSSAAEFSILVNGSGIAGASRQVTLTAQGGALTFQAGGLLNAPPVQSNTSATAANVAVDALGQIRRSTSSLRYKKNVRNYDRGVAAALKLRPVYYESKTEDLAGQIFAGLIAEEVHEAGLTEYVVYDGKGRPDALHYPHMAALFVAVTKELKAEIEDLKAEIKELKTR